MATLVVFCVLSWSYAFAMAVPIETGRAYAIWSERGLAWFGTLVSELLDSLSFLWGSMVRYEYAEPPSSGWPTVVFVILLATFVYAVLRNGSENPRDLSGRVLGAGVLAGGFANLCSVVIFAARTAGESASFIDIGPVPSDDGVWLGIVIGLVGGVLAHAVLVFAQDASPSPEPASSSGRPRTTVSSAARERARQVATWGVLPLLVVVLVGGFVWDYGPDAAVDAVSEPRDGWVRLVWFLHARFGPPADPTSLSGAFETSVWLPRTLTSAAFLVLLWFGTQLLVARWRQAEKPNGLGVVLQVWGLVTVIAILVGVIEGAVGPSPATGSPAYHVALNNVADAVRFGTCFGWIAGVAVALAQRFHGRHGVGAESGDEAHEESTD